MGRRSDRSLLYHAGSETLDADIGRAHGDPGAEPVGDVHDEHDVAEGGVRPGGLDAEEPVEGPAAFVAGPVRVTISPVRSAIRVLAQLPAGSLAITASRRGLRGSRGDAGAASQSRRRSYGVPLRTPIAGRPDPGGAWIETIARSVAAAR